MTCAGVRRTEGTMAATRPGIYSSTSLSSVDNDSRMTSQTSAGPSAVSGPQWPSKSIWGNSSLSQSFATRDIITSKGFAPLTAESDAEVWSSRQPSWTTTKLANGITSPTRNRAEPFLDMPDVSFFASSQHSVQSSIGSRPSNQSAKPRPTSGRDSSSNSFSNQFRDGSSRGESNGRLEEKTRAGFRQGLDYVNLAGGGHRVPASLPSPASEDHSPTQSGGYGDFSYQASTSLSERPSMGASSLPFAPAQSANARAFAANQDQADISRRISGLTLNDGVNGLLNGNALQSRNSTSSQGFRFNPNSQPWDLFAGHTSSFAPESYAEEIRQATALKRGSIPDARESPTASSLGGISSLRSTSQPSNGPCSRPASQDLDLVSRSQSFIASQPQPPPQHFLPSNYFPQGYPVPFQPPPIYDAYLQNYRPPMQFATYPPYPMMNSYYPGPGSLFHRPPRPEVSRGDRSALLEEFRANHKSSKKYELRDIYGHMVEFSGDQHGSRFIQGKLETANSDEKEQVFQEIKKNAVPLMMDVFGNYVIQKFFSHGNQVQKKQLAGFMKGRVYELSIQMYSCRVVQKALEHVLVEQQADLVKELESKAYDVMKDQNGNHVIQKIIEVVPREYVDFIFESWMGRINELATHTYGCRVVQRALEHGNEDDKMVIMQELQSCATLLITDQYGNYVAQHILEHGKPEDRSRIISLVRDQLESYSKHKFASNVVEKCIEFGSTQERRKIVETIMGKSFSHLEIVINDQFGNYVIQKLFKELKGADRAEFVEKVKPHLAALKKTSNNPRNAATYDKLTAAMNEPNDQQAKRYNGTAPSTAPTSPGFAVDLSSATPTPNLITEMNSPSSSSSPNTNMSAEEHVDMKAAKGEYTGPEIGMQHA